jgi:pSer/pThr/pTyr-binding forkhead associated (FHA) protein
MFDLTVATPDGKVLHHIELVEGRPVRIGRSPDNDVRIPDPKVSRQHAEIKPHGDRWVIRDLDSTHGCLVQGQRIRELSITPGLEVRIGPAVVRFTNTTERLAEEIAASIPDEE